jgi:hypothetical protein
MCVAHLQTRFNRVERVVRNALESIPENFRADICAVGDSSAIVLRTRRSTKFSNFFLFIRHFPSIQDGPGGVYLSG